METTKCLGPKPVEQHTALVYKGKNLVGGAVVYNWAQGKELVMCFVTGCRQQWFKTGRLGEMVPNKAMIDAYLEVV